MQASTEVKTIKRNSYGSLWTFAPKMIYILKIAMQYIKPSSWLSHISNTNQSKEIIFAPGVRFSTSRHHSVLTIYNQVEFSNWKTSDYEQSPFFLRPLNCWYSFCDTFWGSHLKKGKSWISPFLWLLFWTQMRSWRVTVDNSPLFIVVSCRCLWLGTYKICTPMTFPLVSKQTKYNCTTTISV